MTVSDAKFEALRNQGFTGANSDMIQQWLVANGATKGATPDMWLEMLAFQGFGDTHRNDGWYQLLGSLGFEGSLSDRELAFWESGGLLDQLGPELLVNNEFTSDLSGWSTVSWVWIGTAHVGAPTQEDLTQTVTTVNGAEYKIEFEINGTNVRSLSLLFGLDTIALDETAPGIYSGRVTATGTANVLTIRAAAGSGAGRVDAASVKQVL